MAIHEGAADGSALPELVGWSRKRRPDWICFDPAEPESRC